MDSAASEAPRGHPHRPPPQAGRRARYLAGLYDLEELGVPLRRQAAQVGLEAAEVWVGLTGGGAGLEDFVRRNFAREPVFIPDVDHPAERLCDLAKLWHPRDGGQAEALGAQWCPTLKRAGGPALIGVREGLEVPQRRAVREELAEALPYLRNNRRRMDDPHYPAQGGLIGSGTVESACQAVVGQRLKLAGRRWGEDGADARCHLRALFKSERGQWDAF